MVTTEEIAQEWNRVFARADVPFRLDPEADGRVRIMRTRAADVEVTSIYPDAVGTTFLAGLVRGAREFRKARCSAWRRHPVRGSQRMNPQLRVVRDWLIGPPPAGWRVRDGVRAWGRETLPIVGWVLVAIVGGVGGLLIAGWPAVLLAAVVVGWGAILGGWMDGRRR